MRARDGETVATGTASRALKARMWQRKTSPRIPHESHSQSIIQVSRHLQSKEIYSGGIKKILKGRLNAV